MASLSAYYPLPVVAGTTAGTYAEGNDPRFGDGLAEAPEDGIIYGRKDADWVDITEPANLQVRRGTAAEVAAITPLEGEPVWETDTKKLIVGDGSTAGGITVGKFPLDGTLRTAVIPNSPKAGTIFISDEVVNLGGAGFGFPKVLGNARGEGSIDLQMSRTQAAQVAAGTYSFIAAGANNTISSGFANSSIISSDGTTISGSGCSAISCAARTISGLRAFSVNSNVSADYAVGFQGTADRHNMLCHGSQGTISGFSSTERAQFVQFILKARTTNDTPTKMVISSVNELTIPNNVALFGQVEICAIEEVNATEAAHYIRKFAIQNLSGTLSLIGTVTTIGTDYESDSSYDVSVLEDATGILKINVTGDTAKTLRWIAVVRGCEMDIA
jgi:hypothetical protein